MQNTQKPFCLAFSPLEYALRDIFHPHTLPQAACGGTAGAGLFQAQGGEREYKRFLCVTFL